METLPVHTADGISNTILSWLDIKAGDSMSPLKLQKLLYYAQAWHYVHFNAPFFNERIEAWMHGPVVPSQYQRFADLTMYASIPVNLLELNPPDLAQPQKDLLKDVLAIYGEHQASYLERLTHSEAPWQHARGDLPGYSKCNREITPASMIAFYSKMLADGRQQA